MNISKTKDKTEVKKKHKTDGIILENKFFKTCFPFLLYMISFIILDIVASIFMSDSGRSFSSLYTNLSVKMIVLLSSLAFILPKIPQIIVFDITSLFMLVYAYAQICFKEAKTELFRISTILVAKEGADFAGGAIKNVPIKITIIFLLVLLIIIGVNIIVIKFYRKPEKSMTIFKTVAGAVLIALSAACLPFVNREYDVVNSDTTENEITFTNYTVCNFTDPAVVMQRSDYFDYCVRDIWSINYVNTHLKQNKQTVSDYFSSKPAHQDNEMTGIFKDKNLMIIQLESLDYTALTEEICPNLYKLQNESINFKNFYTPRFGDTLTFGTETAVNTGLYSTSGFIECNVFYDYAFPYSLANLFGKEGYVSNEYHFNSPGFYYRGKNAPAYGYKAYNQYKDLITDKSYNTEFDDAICKDGLYQALISEDKFIDYIVTYSAHPFFEASEERYKEAAKRHPELAEKLGTDSEGVFKMMCTLTDDMVGELMEKLEKDGVLDNTVIVFITDHLANARFAKNYKDSDQRCNNTPFFIYAKDIKPQTVDKVCKSSDVLPTLLNMFGMEVPSKYIGEDIFDKNYDGFAYFPDMSWITNKGYFKGGSLIEAYTDEEITDDYINENTKRAREYIDMNNIMIYSDYYRDENE